MPYLPKIAPCCLKKCSAVLFFTAVCCLLSIPAIALGEDIMTIGTGHQGSASWQFTVELSRLWKMKFPERENMFIPKYSENINDRFEELNQMHSRLVIAPLKSMPKELFWGESIKVALILWKTYLAPISIGPGKEKVGFDTHHYWFIAKNSIILPFMLNLANLEIESGPVFIKTESETVSQIFDIRALLSSWTSDSESTLSCFEPQTNSFEQELSKEISDDEQQLIKYFKYREKSSFKESDTAVVPERKFVKQLLEVEIFMVENSDLTNISSDYDNGIVFFEMLGPLSNLLEKLDLDMKPVSLQDKFRDRLLELLPWLKPAVIPRAKMATVGITMALFVNEAEDPEFVQDVIKVLMQQPKSFFPSSYLMKNLALKETKTVSSFLLHEGSKIFFDLY